MNGKKVYVTKQTLNGSNSTEFSVERVRDRTRKRQRPPTATFDDSTFRIRRTFRTETAKVHFVRELSRMSPCSVIRTDETTISDDSRDVMTRPEMAPIFFPVESTVERIWRVLLTLCCFSFDLHENPYLMNQLLGNIYIYIYIYIYIALLCSREPVRLARRPCLRGSRELLDCDAIVLLLFLSLLCVVFVYFDCDAILQRSIDTWCRSAVVAIVKQVGSISLS